MATTPGQSALKLKLNDDLHRCMKSGDKIKVSVLRLLLSAVHYSEMNKQVAEFADADIIGVIAKEIKQRNESILAYKQGNRPDLVAQEEAELAVLQTYMPQQASRDDVVATAKKIIAEVGAQTIRDKGKVMPKIIAEFKGKADGKMINDVVTELLNQG
ncbi:MAG: GatB/YqeY domain-containing protein [Dehalococcoidales bacterium]|nr:GatB/YqeY domain-containing protein [Dehalococcoidales bacterium]